MENGVTDYNQLSAFCRDTEVVERFWQKIETGRASECWPWIAKAKTIWGYGVFNIGKGRGIVGAHRLAWVMANGVDIPQGQFILHSCDNPKCCNPAHLRVGSPKENMDDMHSKGRARFVAHKGVKNGRAKLSEQDIRSIREFSGTQKEAARKWGVSQGHVHRIRNGIAWKEVA